MRTVKGWLSRYNYTNWVTRCEGLAARFVITFKHVLTCYLTESYVALHRLFGETSGFDKYILIYIKTMKGTWLSRAEPYTSTDRTLSKGYMHAIAWGSESISLYWSAFLVRSHYQRWVKRNIHFKVRFILKFECLVLHCLNLLIITSLVIRGTKLGTCEFCSLYGSADEKETGAFPKTCAAASIFML